MKRVDVYEVSRKVVTTELDYVEFFQTKGLSKDGEFQPVEGSDGPESFLTFVRHTAPVKRLCHADGRPDVFVAVGPELHDLLLPAVESSALDMARAHEALFKRDLESVREHLAMTRDWLAAAEAAQLRAHERLRNFSQANVFQRVWRAIRRAV